MKYIKYSFVCALALFVTAGISSAAKFHELESSKVSVAPKLDGKGDDASWKKTKKLVVEAVDGPELTIRSVHTDKELFFQISWEDEGASNNQMMWVYDGKKWGVKQEVRFEGEEAWEADSDRIAFQWVINNSIPEFGEKGCRKICHAPEKEDKMYTDAPDQRTDIWQWVSSTTNPVGYAMDQFLTDKNLTKAQEKDDVIRINVAHRDDGNGGQHVHDHHRNVSGDKPKFMPKKLNSGPFLFHGDEVPLSGSFKKGDTIPGNVLSRPHGSGGDVSAVGKYDADDFLWTLELSRKLVTDDKKSDVQFDKGKDYFFGLAVWDNDNLSGHFRVKKPIKLILK